VRLRDHREPISFVTCRMCGYEFGVFEGFAMPDPLTVTAVALLASKTLEGVGGEAGKSAWSGLGRLASAVRRKISRDDGAEAQLDRVTSGNGTAVDLEALASVIEDHIRVDATFREELSNLITEAQRDPTASQFLTVVTGGGQVAKIANIGHVHGNVEL
jgi:hypothetical protein